MNIFYLSKRAALMILTVLTATLLTFMLLRLSPGDPAQLILQKVFVGSEEYIGRAEERKTVEEHLQLNRSLIVQYGHWLAGMATFDLGVSYTTGQKVSHELRLHIWPTLSLALLALALSLLLTVIVSAIYNLSSSPLIRRGLDGAIIMSIAIPNFYLGIIGILVFSLYFDILPVSGFGGAGHYVLPVITLALTMFGYTATILNDSVNDTRNQAYMITAKAKGLSAFTIFRDHILRNAAAPVPMWHCSSVISSEE